MRETLARARIKLAEFEEKQRMWRDDNKPDGTVGIILTMFESWIFIFKKKLIKFTTVEFHVKTMIEPTQTSRFNWHLFFLNFRNFKLHPHLHLHVTFVVVNGQT